MKRFDHQPKAVAEALAIMERLAEMTPRESAEARMRRAKAAFTEAARLALAGDPDAQAAASAAYAEVQAPQAELASLDQCHGQ